jgi:hypothetical protein
VSGEPGSLKTSVALPAGVVPRLGCPRALRHRRYAASTTWSSPLREVSTDGSEPRRAVTVVLALLWTTGCGTIRSHRQVEQPLGTHLISGVGGTLFRLNKLGDLPNAFGGRDIWGGKVDKGFAEVRLAGIEDQTLPFDVIDVNRQFAETTMDRYKPFQRPGLVNVDVQQSVTVGPGGAPTPYRVRLDTTKQRDIVIGGIRLRVLEVQSHPVRYSLEDVQPQ